MTDFITEAAYAVTYSVENNFSQFYFVIVLDVEKLRLSPCCQFIFSTRRD